MKDPFASLLHSVLERFRHPRRVPAEPRLSAHQFRELLIETLDDPATARLLARRLLVPAFPIQGGNPIYASEVCSGNATERTFGGSSCASPGGDFNFPGKLGIGTASPAQALHVVGNIKASQSLILGWGFDVQWSDTSTRIVGTSGATGYLRFETNSAPRMRIDSDGNVGIGTTTPQARLHVQNGNMSSDFYGTAAVETTGNTDLNLIAGASSIASLNFGDTDGNVGKIEYNHANDSMRFHTNAAERMRIDSSGNVGIGTTSPDNKLHVMDGNIAIEAAGGAGKLKFRDSGDHTTRTEVYRDAADFCVVRNREQQDYSILKIWAPPESSFPTTPREATLALVRALDNETKTEFLDLYNNHYSTEKQYGIRIAKSGDGTSFHDFVFDQYDDDQDKKTPVMILKVDGKVGVGTDVPGARLEAADPSVLAGENLRNGALTGGDYWSAAGDMSLGSDKATYTHSGGGGSGSLTQASGDFAIAAKPYRLYLFTYTISNVSGTPPSASITTAFAAASRPLKIKANGTYTDTVLIHAAASPGNFVIEVTSSAAGAFTIDSLSLKEVTGGDIIADGLFTGGGPSGIKVDNVGKVGIGTATPANILSVVQGSSTDPIADSWTTYSSRRHKTNIRPLQGALEKLERLRGVSYERRSDRKRQIGVVGEEVGEVVPEIVAYEENGRDAKSVDYTRLTALLIEAIKEQQGQLRELRRQVEARNAGRRAGRAA